MKTYKSSGLRLAPATDIIYDKSHIDEWLDELHESLSEKFAQRAEKDYQSIQAAKEFVTTV